jgi:cysteine desulfurase
MKRIYFDYNGTTPIYHKIKDNIDEIIDCYSFKNPSAIHYFGQGGKYIVHQVNDLIKNKLSASNYSIIHTSCCTEANNQIINTFKGMQIFVSAIEHHAVLEVANINGKCETISVGQKGLIDLSILENMLQKFREKEPDKKFLCSVMLVNNEVGIVQDVKKIAEIVHKYNGLIHSDITQAVMKMNVNLNDLDLDYATFSGHKIYAGQSGVLLYKNGKVVKPMIYGGGQQKYLRAGTENVLSLLFLQEVFNDYEEIIAKYHQTNKLRKQVEDEIIKIGKWEIVGVESSRICNTIGLITDDDSMTKLIQFDSDGFAVGVGAACSSGQVETSHVLRAMGFSNQKSANFIRISFGIYTTPEEVEGLIEYLKKT